MNSQSDQHVQRHPSINFAEAIVDTQKSTIGLHFLQTLGLVAMIPKNERTARALPDDNQHV